MRQRDLADELREVIAHWEPSDHYFVSGDLLRRIVDCLDRRAHAAEETARKGGYARAERLRAKRST